MVRLDASGQQTGSNRPPQGPTLPLENHDGSLDGSGTDSRAHLRLSSDPSRSLPVRCTGRQRLVGSDTEEDGGSTPPAPTAEALSRSFVDHRVSLMDGIGGEAGASGRRALPCLTKGVLFRGPVMRHLSDGSSDWYGTLREDSLRWSEHIGIVSCRRH